jgi:hypothetical protein
MCTRDPTGSKNSFASIAPVTKEPVMAAQQSLTRRSALAGIGAGSLALFLGASASAAPPAFETGGSGSGEVLSTTTHPLAGRWLSHLALPSRPDVEVVVPTFFGADGTVVMCLPPMEAKKQIGGIALGSWEPMTADLGHFTAVQVLANLDGDYVGTVTMDGYAQTDAEGLGYAVRSDDHLFVVRDQANDIIEELAASAAHPMSGLRMRAGNAGFAASVAAPAGIPEVAPVYADDPRLQPVEQTAPQRQDDRRTPH